MTKGVIIIVGFWWLILGLRLYLDLKEWNRQRLINEQKARNLLSENIEKNYAIKKKRGIVPLFFIFGMSLL